MKKLAIAVVFLLQGFTAPAQNSHGSVSTGSVSTAPACPGSACYVDMNNGQVYITPGSTAGTWITGSRGWYGSGTWVPTETRKIKLPLTTIALVKSTARPLSQSDLAPATYLKLARSVGLSSPATDEAVMLNAISKLGLKVFDYDRVDEYLYEQALKMKANTRWVWKPMRAFDERAIETSGIRYQTKAADGFFYPKRYARRIPERVLLKVCDVMDAMPNAVFLISDFEVVKPDPFLAVTTPKLLAEGKVWIIDNWDEPGFTEKGAAPLPQLTAKR